MVHAWAKKFVKYYGHDIEPVHMFLSGSGGTGKSHSVKVIYSAFEYTGTGIQFDYK